MLQNRRVSTRHLGLDIARYLSSFMVVSIHMSYLGKTYFNPLSRFAVPVFFMLTGYFYSYIKQHNKEYIQLKKSLQLFISANILYLGWDIVICFLTHESISSYFHGIMNLRVWIKFLLFNESLFASHLWYLGSLVYVLIIILLVDKYANREKLYKFIPILLLGNIILGNYSVLIFGTNLPLELSRNFLFLGLPFFLLGDIIHKKKCMFSKKQLLLIISISVLITTIENMIFLSIGSEFNPDFFIATPFLAYAIFIFFLKTKNISANSLLDKLAQLGNITSTTIYIIHPIAIAVIGKTVAAIGKHIPILNAIWNVVGPLVIFFSCTIFACCFKFFQRNLKNFLQIKYNIKK